MTNKKLIQGETLAIYDVWYDNDANVIDLTGYTGNMVIYDRKNAELETIPLTLSSEGEIEGTADSSAWPKGSLEYYTRLVSPSGFVTDLIEGRLTVE
jgi:hypothetical protein